MGETRPKIAVWKFTSCDGCQLRLLNLEDELLALGEVVEFAHFAEATSRRSPGPYDLSLVEGSITTPEERERIEVIRASSRRLVAIGACATAGGIQALRNFADVEDFLRAVYPTPEHISTLERSTPISDHVLVDFELRGCPIDERQLLEVLAAFLAERRPSVARHSVCVECKRRGVACVAVLGRPCLGPVTQAGCGAICPAYRRGCYGCFGPMEAPEVDALARDWRSRGVASADIERMLRSFHAWSEPFRSWTSSDDTEEA